MRNILIHAQDPDIFTALAEAGPVHPINHPLGDRPHFIYLGDAILPGTATVRWVERRVAAVALVVSQFL